MTTETSVRLADHELALLAGKCRPQVQAEVDAALARISAAARYDLPHGLAGLIANIVTEASQTGVVTFRPERVRYCTWCKKDGGYYIYKKGYQKGRANYDKPLYFGAVEFAVRFVSVQNHVSVGACDGCIHTLLPDLKAALADVRAELPKRLQSEGAPLWKRHDNMSCNACGWTGHAGEMGQIRALMGGGTYPGICPSCGVRNEPLGKSHIEKADGFTVAPAPAAETVGEKTQ
jgi:hypothetical protein